MGAASDYLQNKLLDHVFKTGEYTQPTHIFIALCKSTIDKDDTGSTLPGEVSGGGYVRVTCDTWAPASGTNTFAPTENKITFPLATADWGRVSNIAMCDSKTTGNVLTFGRLYDYKDVVTGDQMEFEAGGITVGIDNITSGVAVLVHGHAEATSVTTGRALKTTDYDWLEVDNADRIVDWTYCGVPGGIPNRTTIYTTLSAGATTAQVNTAMQNCPSGQVVKLNAGSYSLGSLTFGSKVGVTLRGAGAWATIINSSSSGNCITTEEIGWAYETAISSGYTKGSTSIVMASTPTYYVAGLLMKVYQDDDITFVMATDGPGQNLSTMHRITGKTGNTITFTPPLPYTLTAGLNPTAAIVFQTGAVLCGIEDLTINSTVGANNVVQFVHADRCWVKGCRVSNAGNSFVFLWDSVQCEIRRSFITHALNAPSNPDGYGVYMYGSNSWALIEDSVFTQMFFGILSSGSSCNATLYSYCWNMQAYDLTWQLPSMNTSHGAHPLMSLWEGNMGEQLQADGYHGSSSHHTIFRNQLHGVHPTNTANRKMIDLCRANYYFNVVGNILGDASWTPDWYEVSGDNEQTIYRLGYPNMGNGSYVPGVPWPPIYGLTYPDAKVKATLLRHGNYDYFNDATVWDAGITSHSIPTSMFYSSKPSYFGSLQWPPIGPDVPGYVTNIPAKARWDAYVISGDVADLF